MFETLAKGFRQARNRLAGLTERLGAMDGVFALTSPPGLGRHSASPSGPSVRSTGSRLATTTNRCRPVTAAGILSGVMRHYFQLLGYWLLIGLMLVLFCLLPLWIWIWVGWVAVMPIMFIENVGLGAAMGRSRRLVEGRWWRTFGIYRS